MRHIPQRSTCNGTEPSPTLVMKVSTKDFEVAQPQRVQHEDSEVGLASELDDIFLKFHDNMMTSENDMSLVCLNTNLRMS